VFPFEGVKTSSYYHPVARETISSRVVDLSLEVIITRCMSVWVQTSLFAVFLVLSSRDFEVFHRVT
jgi:hypothetical protein